jgi:hypothetical protein
MSEDWSRIEAEATVADYFDMLDKELHGLEYNKTTHRHDLIRLLNGRSDGAIERKHQNISAVLIKMGFPYIAGYKPLKNYQQLLFNIVSDRLKDNKNLVNFVGVQVEQPAVVPSIDDILAALVEPPTHEILEHRNIRNKVQEPSMRYGVDYLELEAKNRSLGTAGEQFVVHFEQARLIREGRDDLASKIEHISATQGDGAGFDVLSFDKTGDERFIEVKTTAYGPLTPFFVTKNEVIISRKANDDYYLYRTFDFRRHPKLFKKQGSLDNSFNLDPSQYIASLD